jgi:hypothetical protein
MSLAIARLKPNGCNQLIPRYIPTIVNCRQQTSTSFRIPPSPPIIPLVYSSLRSSFSALYAGVAKAARRLGLGLLQQALPRRRRENQCAVQVDYRCNCEAGLLSGPHIQKNPSYNAWATSSFSCCLFQAHDLPSLLLPWGRAKRGLSSVRF